MDDKGIKIHESAENYLETILVLEQRIARVRSVDIAATLGFSKPSVSVAMKKLRQTGHIIVDADGFVALTAEGRKIAESMLERHTILSRWLVQLGVDEQVATDDACKIEHVVSEQSFQAIKQYIEMQ